MEDFKGVEKKSKLMEQDPNMNTSPFPIKQFVLLVVRRSGYWAIQAGFLTPLTFARHRLSPLAAFTSGAYFLHTGRW